MDERARVLNGETSWVFNAKNGVYVNSSKMPGLSSGLVWVRGLVITYDKDYCILETESYDDARAHKEKIIEALKDWAENWEGWGEKEEAEEPKTDGGFKVYEF